MINHLFTYRLAGFLILIMTPMFVIIYPGCKDSGTNPPEEKPEGYQEDIPWPSLADSPWPKYRHDAQNTGRSNLAGPVNFTVQWNLDSLLLWNELVVDSTDIFVIKGSPNNFCCYDTLGILKWKSQELLGNKLFETPILTSDGNIIIGDAQNIYSYSRSGALNWTFSSQSRGIFISGPAVDKEGNIYFTDGGGNLYSLNKEGSVNWKYYNPGLYSHEESGIPFSPDGKTIYLVGLDSSIFSFDINDQKINWSIDKGSVRSSPMVDNNGNVYFVAERELSPYKMMFYSLTASGAERYSYEFSSSWGKYKIDPTIDRNGNVFFAGDTIYSLDYYGNLRWKTCLPAYNSGPLVCDHEGSIYLVTYNHTLLGVNNDGIIRMSLQYQEPYGVTGYSTVIGINNTLYLSVLDLFDSKHSSLFSIK